MPLEKNPLCHVNVASNGQMGDIILRLGIHDIDWHWPYSIFVVFDNQ